MNISIPKIRSTGYVGTAGFTKFSTSRRTYRTFSFLYRHASTVTVPGRFQVVPSSTKFSMS